MLLIKQAAALIHGKNDKTLKNNIITSVTAMLSASDVIEIE